MRYCPRFSLPTQSLLLISQLSLIAVNYWRAFFVLAPLPFFSFGGAFFQASYAAWSSASLSGFLLMRKSQSGQRVHAKNGFSRPRGFFFTVSPRVSCLLW